MKSKWYFHLQGEVYANGPTDELHKYEMKEYLREAWGNGKRIPDRTQYWRTND